MRLVLALLMCWGVAFAQDTTKYFKSVDYGWNWQRGKFRGGLILPTDTTNNKLGIAQIDATCYAWSGTKWKTISTTDTAFLVRYYRKNQVDSAILANNPIPFDSTSLSNRINLRVKYTDTAAMLTPYLRKIDTASLSNRINLKLNATDTASLSNRINLKLNKSDSIAGGYYPYSSNPKAYLTSASLTGYVPYSSYGSNNVSANNFFYGFTSIDATTTPIILTVNSTPYYLITGRDGQTIKLPNAQTLPLGALFTFNNNQSQGTITVNNNSNTLVKSIPSGANVIIELIDNQTAAGLWDAHSQAPSNVSWSTNTFDYAGSITSATWNGSNVAINRGGTGASTAATARTNLGSTTVGDNFYTLPNPSAKRFTQINADNTISTLDSTSFRAAIGAGTSSTTGTITSISTGNGLSGGTITTSGTIIADTSILATKLLLQKKIDSVNTNVSTKGTGTVTSITLGRGITGTSPITTTGTIGIDTTKNYTWTNTNIFSNSIQTPYINITTPTAGQNPTWQMNDADATTPNYSSVSFNPAISSTTMAFTGPYSGTNGGIQYAGFTGSGVNTSIPLAFIGYQGGTSPTAPCIDFVGYKWNGATNRTTLASGEIILQVENGIGGGSLFNVKGNGNVTLSSLATGIVYSNSGVLTSTNPSDSTLKNNIEDIPYGLNEILRLKPKTYYYNSDSTKTYLKYGFIAQDVQNIMPKIVRKLEPENPESKLGLESEAIYVAMVKAIQQLEARVKELEKILNK